MGAVTVLGNTMRSNGSFGLSFVSTGGYAQNALDDNNGGGAQVQGGIQMGGNVCGHAICP